MIAKGLPTICRDLLAPVLWFQSNMMHWLEHKQRSEAAKTRHKIIYVGSEREIRDFYIKKLVATSPANLCVFCLVCVFAKFVCHTVCVCVRVLSLASVAQVWVSTRTRNPRPKSFSPSRSIWGKFACWQRATFEWRPCLASWSHSPKHHHCICLSVYVKCGKRYAASLPQGVTSDTFGPKVK